MDQREKLLKVEDDVIQMIEVGNYIEVACTACGVSSRAYRLWMTKGRELEEAHMGDFEEKGLDVEEATNEELQEWLPQYSLHDLVCFRLYRRSIKAQARAEIYAVGIVRKHMPDQWTAAMTFLERKNPARWKRRDLHEVAAHDAAADERQRDEAALLENPEATAKIHDALREAARQLPPAHVDADSTELPS